MHYGSFDPGFALLPLIAPLVVWSLFWKGLALWHAGRRGEEWWFIALLIINTAGILEIIYLFVFLKIKWEHLFSKHEYKS